MTIKLIYKENNFVIQAEINPDEEFITDAIDNIKQAKSEAFQCGLINNMPQTQTSQSVAVLNSSANVNTVPNVPATGAQLKLMQDWKIKYEPGISKKDACALIHQYKRDHGMKDL